MLHPFYLDSISAALFGGKRFANVDLSYLDADKCKFSKFKQENGWVIKNNKIRCQQINSCFVI